MVKDIMIALFYAGIYAGITGSIIKCQIDTENEEKKRYNELPLIAGTVVEKIDINTENLETAYLIDTDGNKDTIEKKMTIIKDSFANVAIINSINEGSKIKFKDRYENTTKLLQGDIYQIDDLIVKQR